MIYRKDMMKGVLFKQAGRYNWLENEEKNIRSPAIIVHMVEIISAILEGNS